MTEPEWSMYRRALLVALENTDDANQRSNLMSEAGRMMELRTERVLKNARDRWHDRVFRKVIRHEPNSRGFDRKGIDFTVRMIVKGKIRTVHFGITVSADRRRQSSRKHNGTPQMRFPIRISEREIIEKVLSLFLFP